MISTAGNDNSVPSLLPNRDSRALVSYSRSSHGLSVSGPGCTTGQEVIVLVSWIFSIKKKEGMRFLAILALRLEEK